MLLSYTITYISIILSKDYWLFWIIQLLDTLKMLYLSNIYMNQLNIIPNNPSRLLFDLQLLLNSQWRFLNNLHISLIITIFIFHSNLYSPPNSSFALQCSSWLPISSFLYFSHPVHLLWKYLSLTHLWRQCSKLCGNYVLLSELCVLV
jgi:hypothetical protein